MAENYRSQYEWKKYRDKWEAKGERFELTSFILKPVPLEQNFAATPFFAPYLDYTTDPTDREHPHHWKDEATFEQNKALAASLTGAHSKNKESLNNARWQLGTFTDLHAWQDYFAGNTNFPIASPPKDPASDVLAALRRYGKVLEELRAASTRPYSVFPVHYEENFQALLPHLASLKGLSQILRLRAVALLESGRPAEALQDVQLCLRLADCIKSEPFLISGLVRLAILEGTLQPIWEGLARQRWNETQLRVLESTLQHIDLLKDYGVVMRTERASAISYIDFMRTGKYRDLTPSADASEEGPSEYSKMRYLPAGIFRQNQLSIARLYQERLLPLVDAEKRFVDVREVQSAENFPELNRFHPYNIFARLLLPAVAKAAERFAHAQVDVDLARVACALERYRLATGKYPETLAELSPKFLDKIPSDVITGASLKYQRKQPESFSLYSVGWNERDDGGNVGLTPRHQFDSRKGDWVWPSAADSNKTATANLPK